MSESLLMIAHRRRNPLTGEWVLVSPNRLARPWQGEVTRKIEEKRKPYVPDCYLCPGSRRAGAQTNPRYRGPFVFTNDFPALRPEDQGGRPFGSSLFRAKSESGECRVVVFSPRHDRTLSELSEGQIGDLIRVWQQETAELGGRTDIRSVQIFENKGSIMGNSNPHPHGQIWAQRNIPGELKRETHHQRTYFRKHTRTMLEAVVQQETRLHQRVVYANDTFVVLVPFWAVWPFETLLLPRTASPDLTRLHDSSIRGMAKAIRTVSRAYDRLFGISFPYSAGIHQAPTDGREHPEWHFHMHFFPPLLRSSTIRKYMVGYEMLAEPQRDLTPEAAAAAIRACAR